MDFIKAYKFIKTHTGHLLSASLLTGCLLASVPADGIPAKKVKVLFRQPDGTSFTGCIRGDEFANVKMTEDGQAIVQDGDGWWCYAVFDSDGFRRSSGVRAGSPSAGREILSASSDIPYDRLQRIAAEKRGAAADPSEDDETPMKRLIRRGAQTKADGTAAVQKHGIVILAQFRDVAFTYTKENFVNLLNQSGYSLNGATGCAMDYFRDQFGGSVEFSFDVSDIVTLSKDRAHYGRNDEKNQDSNAVEMIVEACELAAGKGVDFSIYDDDGDGTVDNVFVFFSGADESEGAGDDCIWSHAYYVKRGAGVSKKLCGKYIDRYACSAELRREIVGVSFTDNYLFTGIGTFCHEYTHTFGLPDLYDTDYAKSGGQSEALWYCTALMDGGNSNNFSNTPPFYNAVERERLGIGEGTSLTNGRHTLEPIHRNGKYYRMDADVAGEYYLFECRDNSALWDKYIGGNGLLVYHIDRSPSNKAGKSDSYGKTLSAAERWTWNEVNCRPDRQCVNLVEADPSAVKEAYNADGEFRPNGAMLKRIFFPYAGVSHIDAGNGFIFWSGKSNPVKITDITRNDDGSVSFVVSGVETVGTDPVITFEGTERREDGSFYAGTVLKFSLSEAEGADSIEWSLDGKAVEDGGELRLNASGLLKAVAKYPDGTSITVCKKLIVR